MPNLKPFIPKWPGSKWNKPIADRVIELYAKHRDRVWVEPFVGGGGMLFAVEPERALCSDVCEEVIVVHRWMQSGKAKFVEMPEVYDVEVFNQVRFQFNSMQIDLQQGKLEDKDLDLFCSRFIWLQKTNHNGLYRESSQGKYNTPIKRLPVYPKVKMPKIEDFVAQYQRDYRFQCWSVDQVIVPRDGFVYADPPYLMRFSQYTADSYSKCGWNEHKALAHQLLELDCPVVISNSNHPFIVELYQALGFTVELIEVKRAMGNKKGQATEPALETLSYLRV